jgi:DTW domain-containing protein
MPRASCPRCRRPRAFCLCPADPPLETRSRIVILMHPKEARRTKCGTGRLTRLHLANCAIFVGESFDEDDRVLGILDDPANYPVLLYPCEGAADLSSGPAALPEFGERRLVVFVLDATWSCSRTMIRKNRRIGALLRVAISPREPSRFVIKRQPAAGCLATIEAIHELLLGLETAGIERYADKERLISAFTAMQRVQIESKAAASR